MGNSLKSNKNGAASSAASECQICLSSANPNGGGLALISPGCCGKFYHQTCIDELISNGHTTCPNCRTALSPELLAAAKKTLISSHIQVPRQKQPSLKKLKFQAKERKSTYGSSEISNEDELVEPSCCQTAPVSESDAHAHDMVSITAVPESNQISLDKTDKFYVNVNIRAAERREFLNRQPMDIICVLDNSGSMQGSKLESVMVAMKFVRSQLGPNDRLGIISFNSYSNIEHGLLRMDDTKKQQSDGICESIQAGGGTCIYSGLQAAKNMLDSRKTTNPISCIFVLTDGQDESHPLEKKVLSESIRANGYTLSMFGFGSDHDAAQLQKIANYAEGTFSFVEFDDMVTDAFGGAIGGTQGTMATNLRVSLSIPEGAEVNITSVNAGRYSSARQLDGSYLISYTNLFAGEQRDILVTLSIAKASKDVFSPILLAKAAYNGLDNSIRNATPGQAIENVSCTSSSSGDGDFSFVSPTEPDTFVCMVKRAKHPNTDKNTSIDVQINRIRGLEAMTQAMEAANTGRYGDATILLKNCIALLKASPSYESKNATVLSAVDDLEEALANTSDSHAYHSVGGQAAMCENITSHSAQRKLYNKASKAYNPYQSASSAMMQTDGCNFKSKY